MTIDAVAARAHVSKATIYRRWDGKAELVVAALRDRQVGVHNPPDTGSLRGDLIELLRATAAICTADCDLMQALTFAMRTNPELERLVRHQVLPAERVASTAVLVRATATTGRSTRRPASGSCSTTWRPRSPCPASSRTAYPPMTRSSPRSSTRC